MNYLVGSLIILAICHVRTDVNDIWNSFKTNGGKVNKTNLFIQYEKLCPILNGRYAWKKDKNITVQKGECLLENCKDTLECQLLDNCCHTSSFGYLATSLFDPSVYPKQGVYQHYLLVDHCPYDIIDEIKLKCERLGTSPVTSINTLIIYKNSFCAHCHGEPDTIDWKLVFDCPNANRAQTRFNLLNDCFILYKPQSPHRPPSLVPREFSNLRLHKSPLISKCNVTGLWKHFDNDIDWACRRFKRGYKHFKNLYCYICNPSVVSTRSVDKKSLISTCNDGSPQGDELNQTKLLSQTNSSIPEMCKSSDIEPRLSPYRNAYCLSCNDKLTEHIYSNIGKFEIIGSGAKSFLLQVTLANEINSKFTADAFRKRVESLLKLFVKDTKKVNVPAKTVVGERDGIKRVNIKNQQTLTKDWSKMCPFDPVCSGSHHDLNITIWKNRCVPYCTCNQTCLLSKTLQCCFDKYLQYNVHSCLQESHFPVLINPDIETSDEEISQIVVDKCLPGIEDNNYKLKCSSDDDSDYLINIPVTTSDTSLLPFRNIYCALCNVDVNDVSDVNVYLRARCKQFLEIELLPTVPDVIEAIKYHDCKVAFALNDRLLKYDECTLDTETIVQKKLDFVCLNDSISTGNGQDIDKLCNDNELPIVVNSMSRKYVQCDTCNKLLERRYTRISTLVQCRSHNDSTIWNEYMCFVEDDVWLEYARTGSNFKVLNSYRSLFNIRNLDFERLKQIDYKECRHGTFDIEMGLCRRLYCSSGRLLENDTCTNVFESVINTTFLLRLTLKPCEWSMHETEIGIGHRKLPIIDKTMEIRTESICKGMYKVVEDILGNETASSYMHCSVKVYNCTAKTHNMHDDFDVFKISQNTRIDVNISVNVKLSSQKSHIETQLYYLTQTRMFRVTPEVLCPSPQTFVKDSLLCSEQSLIIPNDTYEYDNTIYYPVNVKKTLFCPLVKIKVTNTSIDRTSGNIVFNYLSHELSVPIDSVETVNTINVQTTLWVCKNDVHFPEHIHVYQRQGKDLEKAYFLFSTSCNIVSLLSLTVTLLTYSMLKVLRTVPGRNNMNLAFCLLLAQASLQFPHESPSSDSSGPTIQCQAVGVCAHFFWLATFFALNVCSFHMYKVFSGRLMLTQSQTKSVFPKYTIYVYGSPFLVILAVLSVNMAARGITGYGLYRCFLDDLYYVIVTFVLPSCLIFVSNTIFYVKTFYIIYNSPTLRCNLEERSTLAIYVKLCTLTGMTWPLLFIDALFPLSVFSFIATFTNAMQGFFIFISFTCNRRVLNLYKRSLSGKQETNTVSNNLDTLSRGQSLKRS